MNYRISLLFVVKDYSNDIVLLEQLKKRDARAYEFLYAISRNRLFLLVDSIIHNEDAAKDLVQEFFADLWQHKLYNNVRFSIKSYVYHALRNRALLFLRNEKSYARVIENYISYDFSETTYPLENQELGAAIQQAIEKLPPMAQKVFKMHYLENKKHAEIADLLGISKRTVNNHIDRALKELRTNLKRKL
jgi:RNA polymerase sigma-70 factor (family 1)